MKNIFSVLTLLSLSAVAIANTSEIKCGDKFNNIVVEYNLGANQDVTSTHSIFDRGALYTSASEKTVGDGFNVYYVKGATKNIDYRSILNSSVEKTKTGIMVTLNNPAKSQISISKKDGKLSFSSKNKELLDAVAGEFKAFDCAD